MFKVLIVDDDAVVRNDLRSIIDWEKYDFFVCGEAIDGLDGLDKIKKLKPDIIFADIKMPLMDGLEMVKEVRKLNISCKIILLTSCNKFEYAATAIAYGVKAYLLKPFNECEINKLLCSMRKELLNEKSENEIREKNQRVIIEEAIYDILFGTDRKANKQLMRVRKLFDGWQKYKIIILIIENKSIMYKDINKLKEKLSKYISENGYGYSFALSERYGILLNDKWDNENDVYYQFVENMRKVISSFFGCEIRFAIGCSVKNINDLKLSYEDAFELENSRFICGKEKLIYTRKNADYNMNNGEKSNLNRIIDYDIIIQNLYFAVIINNEENIKNILNSISNMMVKNKFKEEKAKYTYVEIYRDVIKLVMENDLIMEKEEYDSHNIVSHIFAKSYIEDVNQVIFNELKEISDKLFKGDSKYKIKKLVEYVNKNYDKDLKLEYLSENFCYSNSYIGKLFRRYTGQKFDLYVDSLRIEKAKELLLSGLKVCEVAKKAGFNNIDYFSSKFKKYTGVTPSEYRINSSIVKDKIII